MHVKTSIDTPGNAETVNHKGVQCNYALATQTGWETYTPIYIDVGAHNERKILITVNRLRASSNEAWGRRSDRS
jgi:hypothetical protein